MIDLDTGVIVHGLGSSPDVVLPTPNAIIVVDLDSGVTNGAVQRYIPAEDRFETLLGGTRFRRWPAAVRLDPEHIIYVPTASSIARLISTPVGICANAPTNSIGPRSMPIRPNTDGA